MSISSAENPKVIYLPPFDFMYAFESRVAAFINGAALVPLAFVTAYAGYSSERGGQYLICNKESSEIVVLRECIDDRGERSKLIIGPLRLSFLNLCSESINIKK